MTTLDGQQDGHPLSCQLYGRRVQFPSRPPVAAGRVHGPGARWDDGGMSDPATPARPSPSSASLPQVVREVEDFAASAGWDQPPQLFALLATADLLARQPPLDGQVGVASSLAPVTPEPLPGDDIAETLAGIVWRETVTGCALVQEIVVLELDAEAEL